MNSFRKVELPEVTGGLYLYSMPGRFEPYAEFEEASRLYDIELVVCLTPLEEVNYLSPDYYKAIKKGKTPYEWQQYTIENYKAPEDWSNYAEFIHSLAKRLENGDDMIYHCAAGIGRTGMAAMSTLILLGIEPNEAARRVQEQGASPQRAAQQDVINWMQTQVSN